MAAAPYVVRSARTDELDRVLAIEDEAGTRFAGLALVDPTRDTSFSRERLTELAALGQVWVVCGVEDVPVGMVIASVREGIGWVEEIDVVPEHGRRGLGGRLLERVCAWGRAHRLPAVGLSTFRDVAWNGPFYRRHGFVEIEPAAWTPGMQAIRADEAARGLAIEARVFMRRALGT